jgi:glycosyltransferase involved in cell wall biosynthesis
VRRRPQITIDARLVGAAGIGTYLRNLLPRVIAAKPDWQLTLLGRSQELNQFDWAQREHVSLVSCEAPIYGLAEQVQLAARIPRNTDLMWSPHYNIPLSHRGPLLVTVHDLCHLALPQFVAGAHRRAYARFMFGAIRRRASRIVCDSEFTKRELCRLVGYREPEPVTVHLGVNPRWFRIEAATRPHPRPYILFVGNVKPHKNLVTLIRAFETVARSVPHDLVVVGRQSGLLTGDPAALRAAEALGQRVRFTGEVSDESLEQFFLNADAFVFPSLYEGFGLPPLEAMACGCPTVVAQAGSLPEVCGNAALYFNPCDSSELAAAILRLLTSEALRQELRQRGRSHAAHYDWDRCANATLGLIEELVAA